MSTFRKTVLTTAIIGAGLATTAGSAFATDCSHDSGHVAPSTDQVVERLQQLVAARPRTPSETLAASLDGSQGAIGANVCDILSHNNVLNGNSIDLGARRAPHLRSS